MTPFLIDLIKNTYSGMHEYTLRFTYTHTHPHTHTHIYMYTVTPFKSTLVDKKKDT